MRVHSGERGDQKKADGEFKSGGRIAGRGENPGMGGASSSRGSNESRVGDNSLAHRISTAEADDEDTRECGAHKDGESEDVHGDLVQDSGSDLRHAGTMPRLSGLLLFICG